MNPSHPIHKKQQLPKEVDELDHIEVRRVKQDILKNTCF